MSSNGAVMAKKTKRVDEQFVKTFAAEAQKMAGRTALRKLTTTKKRTWKPTIGAKLGPQEQELRSLLPHDVGSVSVLLLFRKVLGLSPAAVLAFSARQMHQRIGAIAARHNRKVKSPHIVRGDRPGTYRLKRIR